MFRNLFLLIAILLVVWIVRGFIRRSKLNSTQKTTNKDKDMVQCEQCKTYLPKDDAISSDKLFFCGKEHLLEWKEKH